MNSFFRHITLKTADPQFKAADETTPQIEPLAHLDHAESVILLNHIRDGLKTICRKQDDLDERERWLLEAASALVVQLSAIAVELDEIQERRTTTSHNAFQLRAAAEVLEERLSSTPRNYHNAALPESLVAQPQN